MVELLKQGQYAPMPVEHQVIQIYAASNRDDPGKRGWARDIPVAEMTRWATELVQFVDAKYPKVPGTIREKKELTAEVKADLNKALGEFNQIFQPTAAA